jgi:hypothetical protein
MASPVVSGQYGRQDWGSSDEVHAPITASASGDNTIVAAIPGRRIKVIAWDLAVSDAVNVKWRSGSTDITGLYYFGGVGGGIARSQHKEGYFVTGKGQALILNLSGAVPVGGSLVYRVQ